MSFAKNQTLPMVLVCFHRDKFLIVGFDQECFLFCHSKLGFEQNSFETKLF